MTNYYWIVGGSSSQVWSSASCSYVPVTDSTYEAWRTSGNAPTKIASATELFNVLMQQWAPLVQSLGVNVTSTGTPSLNGTYAIDADSVAKITALSTGIAAGKPLPSGGSTFKYPDASLVMRDFTSANFLNFAAVIESFIYNFEQNLSILLGGGTATMPSNNLAIA